MEVLRKCIGGSELKEIVFEEFGVLGLVDRVIKVFIVDIV